MHAHRDRRRFRSRRVPVLGLALALLVLAGMGQPARAQRASFDCLDAKAPVERLICSDGELMRLDGALGEAYAARRQAAGADQAKALLVRQRAWLKRRLDECGIPARGEAPEREQRWAMAPCLAGLYRSRLGELGAEARPPAAGGPMASPGFIHPACLAEAMGDLFGEERPAPVPLAACNRGSAHMPVDVAADDGPSYATALGLEGSNGWISYKPLGRLAEGQEAALVTYNGGGTGHFTAIHVLSRKPEPGGRDTLLSTRVLIQGGDRCNGGISTAMMAGGGVVLERAVTPVDVLDLAGVFKSGQRTEAEVASCALCCVGNAREAYPAGGGDPVLESVTIDDIEVLSGGDSNTADETCLAGLLRRAGPPPRTFSPADMAALGQDFVRTCRGR